MLSPDCISRLGRSGSRRPVAVPRYCGQRGLLACLLACIVVPVPQRRLGTHKVGGRHGSAVRIAVIST